MKMIVKTEARKSTRDPVKKMEEEGKKIEKIVIDSSFANNNNYLGKNIS